MLAACGGSQSQSGVPGWQASSTMTESSSGQDLLYVGDWATNEVGVYTYPQGQLVGTLPSVTYPMGECVDSSGDVFVVWPGGTNYQPTSVIDEYEHGGTTPIATLYDPTRAFGCAIDPTTGNLAAVGVYLVQSGAEYGAVAIFNKAAGNPKMYYAEGFEPFLLCGYDSTGNLLMSEYSPTSAGENVLMRLAKRSSKFQQISLDKTLYAADGNPSSVQWDGKYMTVSSQSPEREIGPSYLYRLHFSGSKATTIGTTILASPRNRRRSGQIYIYGSRVLGSDYRHDEGGVDSWAYPNATKSQKLVPNVSGFDPYGIVISPGATR